MPTGLSGYRRPDLQCQPVFASIVSGMALRRLHGVAPVSLRCTGVMALHGLHGVARVTWRCTDDMPATGHEPNLSAGVWNGWELALPQESGADGD